MLAVLVITWLLLLNPQVLSKPYGSHVENSEEDLDEEIVATTENVISVTDPTETNSRYLNPSGADHDSEEINEGESSADDIIDLNVGGQRIATLRSTLTAVPGSKMAIMFAKDAKNKAKSKDKDASVYFFDYNPTHFSYLLDQLRTIKRIPNFKSYELDIQAPVLDVRFNFSIMLTELGLTPENFLSPIAGTHLNLSINSLNGWKECYRGKYSASFNITTVTSTCSGKRLLVACRSVNDKKTLTVAGIGKRENLFALCSPGTYCNTNKYENIGFYYVEGQVWGFDGRPKGWVNTNTYQYYSGNYGNYGNSVYLNPCDTLDDYSQYRLCWSFRSSNHRGGGDRCGSAKNLHNSKDWERLIYQTD